MSKPKDLCYPCNKCDKWRERTYKIHDVAALVRWRGFQDDIIACDYDPRYTSPDKAKQCPYIKYFGKTIEIGTVVCDLCLQEIPSKRYEIPEGKTYQQCGPPPDIESGGPDGMHICDKCLNKTENIALKEIVLKNRERRGRG